MRKYIVGFLFGAVLMMTFNASAAVNSLLGKQVDVEYPVILNGVELKNKAPAIEGTSYLPVREISETLGLVVDFKDDQVILEDVKKEVEPLMSEEQPVYELNPTSTPEQTTSTDTETPKYTKEHVDMIIHNLQLEIHVHEGMIEYHKRNNTNYAHIEAKLPELYNQLAEFEQIKAELELSQ